MVETKGKMSTIITICNTTSGIGTIKELYTNNIHCVFFKEKKKKRQLTLWSSFSIIIEVASSISISML
jgi:hypothetical protein